jgi:hypothetical protein
MKTRNRHETRIARIITNRLINSCEFVKLVSRACPRNRRLTRAEVGGYKVTEADVSADGEINSYARACRGFVHDHTL